MACVTLGGRQFHIGQLQKRLLILLVLARGQWVTCDQCMDWLYGARRNPPYHEIVWKMICQLRRIFADTCLVIEVWHPFGWRVVMRNEKARS